MRECRKDLFSGGFRCFWYLFSDAESVDDYQSAI